MTRIYCAFAVLLTCSACSTPGPSTPQSTPPVASAAGAPPAASAAKVDGPTKEMGIEGHVVLNKLPAPGSSPAAAKLKPRYSDKAALLVDIQATRPVQAVALDGNDVWPGFGPALAYHTGADGSVSQ